MIYIIVILSSISLIILIHINITMYQHYIRTTGKTRALFGLSEWLVYGYRHYYGIIPIIGFIVSLFLAYKIEIRKIALVAALISLVTIIFSIFSVWRLFL
ncbi:hypothetical protein [Winogradskyella sp. 4-2091]|uniref:hypothetical protein n=1 Tax=Winogradskyella sp. 4-2091 TaxID=3381659 RepID=UPI00389170BB